jgi:hypothetical protein
MAFGLNGIWLKWHFVSMAFGFNGIWFTWHLVSMAFGLFGIFQNAFDLNSIWFQKAFI